MNPSSLPIATDAVPLFMVNTTERSDEDLRAALTTAEPSHRRKPSVRLRSASRHWGPLIGILVPGVLLSLLYMERTYVDMLLLDGFIHVPYIGKALDPGGSLTDLVQSPFAGEHFLLGYRLLLFINAKFFELDMRLDPIVFIACFVVTAMVLYSECARIFTGMRTAFLYAAFLPLGFLSFSFVAPPLILMSTQFVCGATIALLVAWLVQRDLIWSSTPARLVRPLWLALALVPVYFLLSGAYFGGLLAGVAAVYLFRRMLERTPWFERRFVVLAGMLVACAGTYTYFMVDSFVYQGRSGSSSLNLPTDDLKGFLFSYPAGIGAGLLDSHTIEATSSTVVLAVGTTALLIMVISLWIFVKVGMYRKTYLPLYCIFYSLGIITVVHAGRGGMTGHLGWRWITSEWYSFHLRFAAVGVTWILIYASVQALQQLRTGRASGADRRVWPLAFAAVAGVFLATCQFVGNKAQWRRAPHVKQYYQQKQFALLYPQMVEDLETMLLWPAEQLAISRAVLQRHSLSIFSPATRAEVARRIEQPVRTSGWYDDGWVAQQGATVFVSRTSGPVTVEAHVPDFIPSNRCEVRLNDVVIMAAEISGGSTTTASSRLRRDTNLVVSKCERAASPSSLGVGDDERSLAVRLKIRPS